MVLAFEMTALALVQIIRQHWLTLTLLCQNCRVITSESNIGFWGYLGIIFYWILRLSVAILGLRDASASKKQRSCCRCWPVVAIYIIQRIKNPDTLVSTPWCKELLSELTELNSTKKVIILVENLYICAADKFVTERQKIVDGVHWLSEQNFGFKKGCSKNLLVLVISIENHVCFDFLQASCIMDWHFMAAIFFGATGKWRTGTCLSFSIWQLVTDTMAL